MREREREKERDVLLSSCRGKNEEDNAIKSNEIMHADRLKRSQTNSLRIGSRAEERNSKGEKNEVFLVDIERR